MSKYVIGAIHCLQCEELSKEIDELQRQNAILVEAISYAHIRNGMLKVRDALNTTSTQAAAWLEASHIEWMKSLGSITHVIINTGDIVQYQLHGKSVCKLQVPLYAIPTKKD